MDTTGNFAGCIETRNGFAGLRADHLSLIVNADAAHAVVKFRPESHRIERSLEFNSLIQGTAEELVFTCCHHLVPFGDLLFQRLKRSAVEFGERFDGVKLLNRAFSEACLESRTIDRRFFGTESGNWGIC